MIYLKKDFKTPVEKVVVKKRVKVLPDYINEVTIPNIVRDRTKKEEKPVIVPLTKEEKILKQLDNSLTIEDYKILLKVLKEKQKKEERKYTQDNKVQELMDLYKSVR